MANYNNLKATINANIKANGNEEITGPILNTVLNQAVTTLGDGWSYKGIATPSMSPGTPDSNVFYIATTAGTYTNFGSLVVAEGEVAILKYNGSWAKEVTGAATAAQVTQLGQEVNGTTLEYSRVANGVTKDLTPPLQPGLIITSVEGLGSLTTTYITLYKNAQDATGFRLFINTALPFVVDKTYERWGAYASGSPTVIMTAVYKGITEKIDDLSADVDQLSESVELLSDTQDEILSIADKKPDLVLIQDGATLDTSGNIVSSQYTSEFKVCSFPIPEGFDGLVKIAFSNFLGSGYSVACGYDTNGNFIKSFLNKVAGVGADSALIPIEKQIATLKVTIPKLKEDDFVFELFTYGEVFSSALNTQGQKHFINVFPNATGDNSLLGILKSLSQDSSATKPSNLHQYEIILQAGEYDMDCSDQIDELPRGVFVPPYTTIKGAGRGVTFLKYIYDGTNDTVMSEHSVLNMPYTSTLEDVTCIAENIRYTIHSDLAETGKSAENSEVVLRNVELIHNGITNGETPTTNNPSAWGGGTLSGQVRKFYNCKFVAAMFAPFANHDRNTNTSAQYFEFQNCEFEALRVNNSDLVTDYATPAVLLNSWGSGVPVFVNFVNCYANKWVGLYTTGNFDSDYQVKCDNELLFHIKENTANPQNKRHYITGGCREFVFTNSTTKGTPVVMENSRSARAAIATDAPALIVGVLIHDVSAGDVGVVMFSGLFAVQQIIGNSFSAGDLIGWNGSSWVVDSNNPIAVLLTNKIAKVI